MLEPFWYFIKQPKRIAIAITTNPVEAFTRFQDRFSQLIENRRSSKISPEVDHDWESRLHTAIGITWPCNAIPEFWQLWRGVNEELKARGIDAGPESFGCWNDGDAGFVRAVWCLVRHLRPRVVVETGVAHGVTSRFILEALEQNSREGYGEGHLWSIDLPPIESEWGEQIGMAVGTRFSDRWTYIKGSSRRHLPGLLAERGQIDLFVHDSLHSTRNVHFEMDRAWKALRTGGALVVDDIDVNDAFQPFRKNHPNNQALVCEAEPTRPD